MTDTIKTSLTLSKLSERARMDVEANICSVSTPWGEAKARYNKPSRQPSPMAATDTKWVVRCEPGVCSENVPTRIDAELNIPNATTGQNAVHGTSVYAAGIASFYLQLIWLARCGLPGPELDLLTSDDVSLKGVTITYLIQCESQRQAEDVVRSIQVTSKVLHGKRCISWSSANDTVKYSHRDFTVAAYVKTNLTRCAWEQDAPVESIRQAALSMVRIEVKLGQVYLRNSGLTALVKWRHAYADGLYEKIFDDTVRASLRLNGEQLRHKAPREEILARLTPTEANVLQGYLAEPPIDPRRSEVIARSASPTNRFYELRKSILQKARVDIDIQWAEHKKLRCYELSERLVYPGDFRPAPEHAKWSFCEANWDALRARMRAMYKETIIRHDRSSSMRLSDW